MKIKRIAITGNIGSGKSLVCKIFNHLGINTFYSDEETKKLYFLPDVKKEIVGRFGEEVYFEDGSLNKKLLSYKIVTVSKPQPKEGKSYKAFHAYAVEETGVAGD